MHRIPLALAALALPACLIGDEPQPMTYDEFVAAHVSQSTDEEGLPFLSYDGDTPLESMADVEQLYAAYRTVHATGEQVSESIVGNQNGVDIIWSAADRVNLTYCVSNAFGAKKAAVISAMAGAAGAWQTAAADKIKFIYVAGQDANCTATNTAVKFHVAPVPTASFYAQAFFPNYGRAQRHVFINKALVFDKAPPVPLVGLLRHELGHSLGLRHETIRKITAFFEGNQCLENMLFRDVSKVYDESSVMITPACLGLDGVLDNNPQLALSFFDQLGIKKIYR
jgi:serralysin